MQADARAAPAVAPRRRAGGLVGVGLLALAACATPPVGAPPPFAAPPAPNAAERARGEYERRLRTQAETAMAERRWSDAALRWEVIATLRPADPVVAGRLAEARQRTAVAVADLETRADQALLRGDAETAAQRWWAALALDPTNATAAAGLRRLEADRNRRLYLGRHAGSTLTRRAVAEAEAMPAGPAPRPAATRRSGLDPAAALAADGDAERSARLATTGAPSRPGSARKTPALAPRAAASGALPAQASTTPLRTGESL